MAYPPVLPFQWELTIALDALPTQVASSDELHFLACYYDPAADWAALDGAYGGVLMGIAVTPSGRVALKVHMILAGPIFVPVLFTPINTIRADSQFHVISAYYHHLNGQYVRSISLDGVPVITRYESTSTDEAELVFGWDPLSDIGLSQRLSLLNSPVGNTNLAARISRFVVAPGILEYDFPNPLPDVLVPTVNTIGFNFDLGVAYVSPLLGTPYGPIPNVDPNTQIVGWNKTPFLPREPVPPVFVPVPR